MYEFKTIKLSQSDLKYKCFLKIRLTLIKTYQRKVLLVALGKNVAFYLITFFNSCTSSPYSLALSKLGESLFFFHREWGGCWVRPLTCLDKTEEKWNTRVRNNDEKLVQRVEPTKQYTKSQNKYAPRTKQLKIKCDKYPNQQSNYRRGIRIWKIIVTIVFAIPQLLSMKHFIKIW